MRRAKFIEVAAQLIGERGYQGVTMTAIADQAKASIGTLYDYFPDKANLALAIKAQNVQEIDEYWKVFLRNSSSLTAKALADLFVEGALELIRKWPAYLPLLDAPIGFTRSAAARRPIRKTIAGALQAKNVKVSNEQAYLYAQVIVELIKSLLSVYKNSAAQERDAVAGEFKKLIRFYVVQILK